MKKSTIACCALLLWPAYPLAQDVPEAKRLQPLTRGQSLFIPPLEHDFDSHLKSALEKHKVKLQVVDSIDQAELVLSAEIEVKEMKPDPINTLAWR